MIYQVEVLTAWLDVDGNQNHFIADVIKRYPGEWSVDVQQEVIPPNPNLVIVVGVITADTLTALENDGEIEILTSEIHIDE